MSKPSSRAARTMCAQRAFVRTLITYIIGAHAPSSIPDFVSAAATHKLKQAEERLRNGDIAGARLLCEQVLERAPRNPDAPCLLGVSRLLAGEPGAALPFFHRTLAVDPQHGMALEHLGLAHLLLGEFPDAERALRRAAALRGAPASVFMRLGAALLHQGKSAEAARELERALVLAPGDVDSHLNLGRALAQLGDDAAARREFNTVLRHAPGHADAMFNLGVISLNRDELGEARDWFERALAHAPRHADALLNLGVVFDRQQRSDEALNCFRRAFELDPRLAPASNNLARTLAMRGEIGQAREQYRRTLQFAPDSLEAHEGLAAASLALGRFKESIAHLREVVRLDPANRWARASLADALFEAGELDEAQSVAAQARELDPGAAGPYLVAATIQLVRGELDRAIAELEAGFQRTGASSLLSLLAHLLRRTCDWERWREAWGEMARRLEHTAETGSPFWLLLEDTTPEQQLSCTRRWAAARFGTAAARTSAPRPALSGTQRRLRVGYLSSDFHEHAAAYLLAGVFERHDRERFEVFAYSCGPEDNSATRARLRRACEHFIDVAWDPDDVVVRRIQDDALDILVDLKGYTVGARTSILARRPCPVQVNWMGYPGTMGADFIDYLIADRFIVPPARQKDYSERVLYLEHCWQCNDRERPALEPLTRAQYGLPEAGFVFCCFPQAAKITPQIFACWMNLLQRVPGSTLWLADDNRWATGRLRQAARAHGVAPERLVFAPKAPFAQYLARYRVADLALDTFPYTSHSTASDALWSGCPLVALCGETFAARVSGSILTHCGLPELITCTLDDYEALACRLATDAALLAGVRSRVARARATSLFDAESFARDLERVYLDLASRHH